MHSLKRMIQRIQSIYLVLIIALNAVASFFYHQLDQLANIVTSISFEYLILFCTILLLAFWALFSYKNRSLQSKLGIGILFLNSVVLGFLVYTLLILPGEINFSQKGIWVIVPFISIVLIVLALKGIKRYDNLVKSANRFR